MDLVPSGEANFLYQIDTLNKRFFITETMFNVEFLLSLILQQIQPHQKNKTYKDIIDDLNNLILKDNDKRNILYAPYLIRNSFHNNGHIRRLAKEFTIKLNEREYQFKKGQTTFAGWNDIIIFINGILSILIEIIESYKVKDRGFIASLFEDERTTGFDTLD